MSDSRLSGLMLRWQQAYEQGQDLSATELCRDCPELTAVVTRQIELLREANRLTPAAVTDATLVGLDTPSSVHPKSAAPPAPKAPAPPAPAQATDSGTLIAPAGFLPPEIAHLLSPPEQQGELGRFGG